MFFAAYWSGPCQGWGSLLQSFKNEMNQETNNFMEIVLVPMCNTISLGVPGEESKEEGYLMEFLQLCGCTMLPMEEQYNIEVLKEKFLVTEIPALVVLDRFGQEVCRDGIAEIKKYTK